MKGKIWSMVKPNITALLKERSNKVMAIDIP